MSTNRTSTSGSYRTQVIKTYSAVPTSNSYLKRPRCLVNFRYQIQNRSDLSYFFPINLSDLSFVNFVNFHLACILHTPSLSSNPKSMIKRGLMCLSEPKYLKHTDSLLINSPYKNLPIGKTSNMALSKIHTTLPIQADMDY